MAVPEDRELFLLLCRGLVGTYCSHVVLADARFGVIPSPVPSPGSGPSFFLDFTESDFERAVAVSEEDAKSLWPDRPTRRRGLQLMLVHVDEEIATTRGAPDSYVMTLPDGRVVVDPWGPRSIAAVAAAGEAAAAEERRIRRAVDEGLKMGHTLEWR